MVTVAVRVLRAAVLPLALIGLTALAGVVLGRVYAGGLLTWLVIGAAAGSVLVSVAARRLPSWLVAPVSVAAMAGWTLWSLRLAATRAELPGGLLEVTADAARNGIPRLLTAMIPVEPTPDTVLVPVVAAWLAGLTGAEVALRTGRVLLGYLPAAGLYAAALYVVGPNAEPAVGSTLVFVAVAALGLATPTGTAPGGGDPTADLTPRVRAAVRLRLATSAALGVAVVVGLVALLGPVVAEQVDGRPVDPRRYVEPPQVQTLDENPLIRISGWALHPEQKLLDVSTERPDAPPEADPAADSARSVRIRLAVLSDYDGVTWRVGATYRNAGRILPAATAAQDSTVQTVRQQISVAELSGRLLPAVATPREVSGARVAYDPASGTLIRPEGLTPGLRYTVTSAEERPDSNLLATANVPAGDEVARVLRVADGVPDPMRRLATQLAEENGAPYARASAIEQFLAEHYRVVADAPSGHAYPNLGFFLFGPRNGGGQEGTSEQFAAAFAVLGRLSGLPTRVVVGFRTSGQGPVLAGDAYAWPEVLFDGLGWVAFDPLPRPNDEPRPVEEDFRPTPEDPPPSEAPAPTAEPSASPEPVAAADAPPGPDGVSTPVLVAGGSGGLLLVVGALLLTLLAMRRSLTRSRLVRGDPGQRIAGAWREVTDALRLAGRPVGDDLAATEVAGHARQTLADARAGTTGDDTTADPEAVAPTGGTAAADASSPAVDELAALLNQVGFAPGAATPDQAARAAEVATAYVATLRSARPWWRRLIWSVHPTPLRRARRSPR
ncbi:MULTISPECIES: transglutaminaseTgpA domain-containing protein [Micromonospora]|uniref:Transglutaminase-like putative cysteine protease n=1 Tax=Micromonospora vinacea TaxID=709878 RepID=A0ABS0KC20_9ACTN|nr:transglutaminaseTgpA domain-containing protein [Micromonospora vinacea]MBG6106036.1 transglutaminase-like putative cysteine protease [Micromonospora vinacea]WSZ77726.1 transglutaminaseTgpA domain-containing protein [Micromonospora sp. NBC_00860]